MAWDGDAPVAGAALFRVANEPLPLPEVARRFMESIFKHKPLLVCRSPLADTSAPLLPGEPLRDEALSVLALAAQEELEHRRRVLDRKRQIMEAQVTALQAEISAEEVELQGLKDKSRLQQKIAGEERERLALARKADAPEFKVGK